MHEKWHCSIILNQVFITIAFHLTIHALYMYSFSQWVEKVLTQRMLCTCWQNVNRTGFENLEKYDKLLGNYHFQDKIIIYKFWCKIKFF